MQTPESLEPAVAHVAGPFQAPRGTHDVLPPESLRWQALVTAFGAAASRAGYGLIQNPMFEDVAVFKRMGEGTDVVRKEMYDFFDRSDPPHHLSLRPEGTASVVRAYVEHHPVPPWKVWYVAPNFRYENTQANRYRQHHQIGVEAIGPADPDLDVEVVALLSDFYRQLGLSEVQLVINSIGTPEDRAAYSEVLRAFLIENAADLAPDDRDKIDSHPMRVLDSKRAETNDVIVGAPLLIDALSEEASAHFERVQRGLTALEIEFTVDPRLVRGLDYYTHTAFEFQSGALGGAQNTIGGGGRYDGLVEALGGPPTPGIGFGSGIERVLAACDAEGVFGVPERTLDVYVVDLTGGENARDVTFELRRAGVSADRGFDQRSMKSQMKSANRSGARFAIIIGEDEAATATATLRDLRSAAEPDSDSRQRSIERNQLIEHLRKVL